MIYSLRVLTYLLRHNLVGPAPPQHCSEYSTVLYSVYTRSDISTSHSLNILCILRLNVLLLYCFTLIFYLWPFIGHMRA